MIRAIRISICLLIALSSATFAQSLEEVLSKHIAARGGAEKLAAMKSFRQTGQLDLGGGRLATLATAQKRPNLLRMELIQPGMQTAVRAYDGKNGWMFMPMMGKTQPEAADPATQQELIEESDFGGALLDWKEKGHKLELLGRENVEGKDCYKIEVTRAGSGDKRQYFLDPDTFLEVRVTGTQQAGAFSQTLSDNKAVEGLTFPFTSVVEMTAPNGQVQKFVYKVDKIEINPDLPDEHFKMPTTMPSK